MSNLLTVHKPFASVYGRNGAEVLPHSNNIYYLGNLNWIGILPDEKKIIKIRESSTIHHRIF